MICTNIEARNQDRAGASDVIDSQIYQKRDKVVTWWIELLPEAEAELMNMPADIRARFLHIAELLTAFGPQQVGMPHIRSLEGKLWEIRLTGRDGVARAIYVARSRQRLTVLHVFGKKTQKTPRKAMKTAQERLRSLDDE